MRKDGNLYLDYLRALVDGAVGVEVLLVQSVFQICLHGTFHSESWKALANRVLIISQNVRIGICHLLAWLPGEQRVVEQA